MPNVTQSCVIVYRAKVGIHNTHIVLLKFGARKKPEFNPRLRLAPKDHQEIR